MIADMDIYLFIYPCHFINHLYGVKKSIEAPDIATSISHITCSSFESFCVLRFGLQFTCYKKRET